MTTEPEHLTFHEFVKIHDYGLLDQQAHRALQEAIVAANRHRKPATVTIKLTIVPNDEFVTISATVDPKLPQPAAATKTYYVDHDGHYSRENLTRPELFARPAGIDEQGEITTTEGTN